MHILQDIESGLYLKCRGFHISLYTRSQDKAMKFKNRQEAEDFALEKGIDKEFIAIPKVTFDLFTYQ